jgi:hypothetical protein
MGSRSIGGSRVKKHAVSSDTKETTLRGQRPSGIHEQYLLDLVTFNHLKILPQTHSPQIIFNDCVAKTMHCRNVGPFLLRNEFRLSIFPELPPHTLRSLLSKCDDCYLVSARVEVTCQKLNSFCQLISLSGTRSRQNKNRAGVDLVSVVGKLNLFLRSGSGCC